MSQSRNHRNGRRGQARRKDDSGVYSWEQPTVKTIYGLAGSRKTEEAFLVRVCTGRGYTRRGDGKWELWKGNPVVLTKGNGADGDAGRIGSWDDGLFVLREGDMVCVGPSGDGPAYALFVENGKVQSEPWIAWKVGDPKATRTSTLPKAPRLTDTYRPNGLVES